MKTNFNHEESLALINEMICRARNNVQTERMYSVLFWGYTVAFLALTNFVLIHVLNNPNQSFLVWLVILPAWLVSYFIDRKIDRTALIKTHIDKIGDVVWKGFGIGTMVFLVIIYTVAFRLMDFELMLLITPVYMTLIGVCEFATACIYRSKAWNWVAVLFWVGAISCAFLQTDWQFIILAACMILGFVVPGHLLNRQQKQSNV